MMIASFGKLASLPVLVWNFEDQHMVWLNGFVGLANLIALRELS
jgi:hypothetical protein